MIFLICLCVVTVLLLFLNIKTIKETKSLSTDERLDKLSCVLPKNIDICENMLKMINSSCKIELDDKTKISAYIFLNDKIILSNREESRKYYSRVLFIAHECIHSIQNKKMHAINFVFANLMYIYDIFLIIMLVLAKCTFSMIATALIISVMHFYFRIIMETDAVYRSVWLSREYLNNKNLNEIIKQYEYIIPKTISSMYFSYILPIMIKMILFTSAYLIL